MPVVTEGNTCGAIRTQKRAILLSFILNRNILGYGFPRQGFALPRNDIPGGTLPHRTDKLKFVWLLCRGRSFEQLKGVLRIAQHTFYDSFSNFFSTVWRMVI